MESPRFRPSALHPSAFLRASLALQALGLSLVLTVLSCCSPAAGEVEESGVGESQAASSGSGGDGAVGGVVPIANPADGGTKDQMTDSKIEVATLGAGCFWCIEAVLEQVDGIVSVESGYMGGEKPNPTYEAVCTGTTGHAEVVQVSFDTDKISFASLLRWFWKAHDPTTLNRQGNDVGTQYRSAIFFHDEEQKRIALASKETAQSGFEDPIVTEISPAGPFFEAEDYHQDYYRQNKNQGYCRFIIAPKLDKLGLQK